VTLELACRTAASRASAADRRRVKPGNGLAGARDRQARMRPEVGREGCSVRPGVGAYRISELMGHIASVWCYAVEAGALR